MFETTIPDLRVVTIPDLRVATRGAVDVQR
jgi:hypothetical protein